MSWCINLNMSLFTYPSICTSCWYSVHYVVETRGHNHYSRWRRREYGLLLHYEVFSNLVMYIGASCRCNNVWTASCKEGERTIIVNKRGQVMQYLIEEMVREIFMDIWSDVVVIPAVSLCARNANFRIRDNREFQKFSFGKQNSKKWGKQEDETAGMNHEYSPLSSTYKRGTWGTWAQAV